MRMDTKQEFVSSATRIKIRRQTKLTVATACLLAVSSSLTGCGGGTESTEPAENQTTARPVDSNAVAIPNNVAAATPQTQVSANPADNPADSDSTAATIDLRPLLKYDSQNPLVGSWLGVANLDLDILRQRLDKAEGEEQQELAKMAQTFRSYQMAMDLYQDGRMGVVIQAFIDGKEHFEQITGTWRVTEQDGNAFVVELIEQIEGSDPNTVSVRMLVSDNHGQMVRPAEIDQRLLVCEPMFVFDRISENFAQQVATNPEATEIK